MKTLLSVIIALVYFAHCYSQQDLLPAYPREITYRGDIAYFNGSRFTGLLVDEKTNKQLGVFRNGYKNGKFTEYYNDGKKKSEVSYAMGIRNGVWTEWYNNGQKKVELNYIKGSPSGLFREWHNNGKLKREISYSDGKVADGEYKILDDKGEVTERDTYKNNKLFLKKYGTGKYEQYYESGELRYVGNQNEQGTLDGLITEYWQDGKKRSEVVYSNGMLNGLLTTWDENSFKTSEQYYKDGKKDSISVFWDPNGVSITKLFKNDVLIHEQTKDPSNLVSNLGNDAILFYYLNGIEKNKVFVKVKFIDKYLGNDDGKIQMAANIINSMKNRLVMVNDATPFYDEYVSYTIEFFELEYFTQGKYSEESGGTMYTGNCSYKIRLYDNKNKKLFEDKYNSGDKKTLFTTYYGDQQRAFRQGIKKADSESFMYKCFPIQTVIAEITSMKGNQAKTVKIPVGSENGAKRKLPFNVYSGTLSEASIIGELEITKVYPNYSLCKVTSGEEAILSHFNSNHEIKIISNYKN
ncbi:MAG: toxin-antitoxin system YwqK family antitoxin [Synergistaceae bacterium]|jgi:antitoxin component YwqK of YwqJK toxin-antitoxin module|nr:toxin-antitoxin system YwqK family antitoxin [Synergistaceae bacterium]MDY0388931.1 toxin-antitoxin system YwqK family antitoxin [Methanolobus sp.]